ncbi:UNVERIFIED_CONTAM: hypothetical protein FKN15_003594 [Acipenser sinensis]
MYLTHGRITLVILNNRTTLPLSPRRSDAKPAPRDALQIRAAPNSSRQIRAAPNSSKQIRAAPNSSSQIQTAPGRSEQLEADPSSSKELQKDAGWLYLGSWTLPLPRATESPRMSSEKKMKELVKRCSADDLWIVEEKRRKRKLAREMPISFSRQGAELSDDLWKARVRLSLTTSVPFPPLPLKAHSFSQSTPIGLDCLGWRRRISYPGLSRSAMRGALVWDRESTQPAEDITRPKRLLHQIHSDNEIPHSELDTRVKTDSDGRARTLHLAQASFLVDAFEKSFILELDLNHNLLSSRYVERHFSEDGTVLQSSGGEHCYYHGTLRGIPGSFAAVSTCHGLQ